MSQEYSMKLHYFHIFLFFLNRGEKHISIEDILKGFPSHLKKDFKKEIDELVRENTLLTKPTSYGRRYSLNSRMREEVAKILSR